MRNRVTLSAALARVFEYDFDYLDRFSSAFGARDRRAASSRYPVGYELF